MKKQIFMDTAFLLAVIDSSDTYHNIAIECYQKLIKEKRSVITTEAILIEIGNGLSKFKWRQIAHQWITRIQKSNTIFKVIPITTEILNNAIELYSSRPDKEWGLTDCSSFVVMQQLDLTKALTVDRHFEQAGYKISLDIDN
jgi:hypothetical protein